MHQSEILERYEGRGVFRIYLDAEAANALSVAAQANGRVYIDLNTAGIQNIQIKAGWFIISGGGGARQQYYINPEHVVAIVWSTDEDLP